MRNSNIKAVSAKSRVLYLSSGDKSNLGNWRDIVRLGFGEESPAYKHMVKLIKEAPNGENELVMIEENPFIDILADIHDGVVAEV